MIIGVFAHLALHWKWIVAMTKKTFFAPAKPTRTPATANGTAVSRRHFLRTVGLGALALGTAAVSYKTIFGSSDDTDSQASTSASEVAPAATIAPLATVPAQNTSVESLPAPEVQAITNEAAVQPTVAQPTATVVEPTATSIPLQVAPTENTTARTTVACHKGVTYDAYPGKCRHYIDADGDGYCDLSIPSSA